MLKINVIVKMIISSIFSVNSYFSIVNQDFQYVFYLKIVSVSHHGNVSEPG
jgi:hypothetical protein